MSETDLPALLTVAEAAVLLRVNRKTIYEAIRCGNMPGAIRVGRVLRIQRDAVLSWDRQGRVVPTRKGRQ